MDSRTRWSPKLFILCWVVMGRSIQGQLTERFREGRETLGRMFYRRRRCGEGYQGLNAKLDALAQLCQSEIAA